MQTAPVGPPPDPSPAAGRWGGSGQRAIMDGVPAKRHANDTPAITRCGGGLSCQSAGAGKGTSRRGEREGNDEATAARGQRRPQLTKPIRRMPRAPPRPPPIRLQGRVARPPWSLRTAVVGGVDEGGSGGSTWILSHTPTPGYQHRGGGRPRSSPAVAGDGNLFRSRRTTVKAG